MPFFAWPSVGLAEIAWRWSFGLAALFLLAFGFREYLQTLPVGRRDLLLLRSGQAAFISQALAHIFHGSAGRAARAALVIGLALTAAWTVVAALGRAATSRAILSYFKDQGIGESVDGASWRLSGLLGINFFRATASLAALVGLLAAWLLAARVSPSSDPSPGSAFLIFLTSLMFLFLAWGSVNWFLSLASIFTVADGEDTFGAMGAAVELCRGRLGSVMAVSFWFGLAHIVAFVVTASVIAFPVGFAAVLPGGVVFGGVLFVVLAYFAVADFLYVGRLAGYLAINEIPLVIGLPEPPSRPFMPQSELSGPSISSAVDAEELILSDVPAPVDQPPASSY